MVKLDRENRILLTLDEHFGDWVILPLKKHPGVIRIKVNPATTGTFGIFFAFLKTAFQPTVQGSSCYSLCDTSEMGANLNFLSRNNQVLPFDKRRAAGLNNQQ